MNTLDTCRCASRASEKHPYQSATGQRHEPVSAVAIPKAFSFIPFRTAFKFKNFKRSEQHQVPGVIRKNN
ncbi:MAG: hypothetical protein ABI642_04865 [Polaromonas sp.]